MTSASASASATSAAPVGGAASADSATTASPAVGGAPIHAYYERRTESDAQLDSEVRFAIDCGLEYARNVAQRLGRAVEPRPALEGCSILELGPGINFGALLVCAAFGASRIAVLDKYLVAWNRDYHPRFYRRLREAAPARLPDGPRLNWRPLDAILAAGAHPPEAVTMDAGDLSAGGTPFRDGEFDAIVSNAVLEHVGDVRSMARELARVTRPGGVGIHQVDFRDHSYPDEPLNFLAAPDDRYARAFIESKGGGGNRVRPKELAGVFAETGFEVEDFHANSLAEVKYVERIRPTLLPRYAAMPVEDLRVVGGRLFVRRQAAASEAEAAAKGASIESPVREPASGAGAAADAEADIAIHVRGLSKRYKIYRHPAHVLKEAILRKPCHLEHWALRDVSFDVRRGEIVGVVGANGAGKSTLLRILAGVLDATSGSFDVRGQLRAILQLGTGFHDEYTGRENVYMGGYCLGYSRAEIDESLEWIIEFSGLRHVIDQPFRTYSSGMKGRLTFAVTFCRKPDILIVDEALATGDLAFSQKCVNRIIELCGGGSTALVVSHSMFFIEKLCARALYLRDGRLVDDGPCRRVTKLYEKQLLAEFAEKTDEVPGGAIAATASPAGDPPKPLASAATNGPGKPPAAAPPPSIASPDRDDPAYPPLPADVQALLDDPEGKCPPILHLGLVRLLAVRVLDGTGREREQFHTGEPLAIEFDVESRVSKDGVVVGVQIFHESNVHVATSTNRVHLSETGEPRCVPFNLRRGRQTFRVDFPRLFLSDGKYFVGLGISPKPRHFTEADQLLREKRVAVFGFYRDDIPWKTLYDPPSRWTKLPPRST